MYNAYITTIKNLRPHPNANRLQLGDCFGNTVCVSLDYTEDTLGVYFPCDGQLSEEFCRENDLVRRKDENGNPAGGYMEPDKRNVKAIKLRGEKSDGLFLPISALNYCFAHRDASIELQYGDIIDGVLNGHDICCKYIPRSNRSHCAHGANSKKNKKNKKEAEAIFPQHIDTPQLKFYLDDFKEGDLITISEKLEGTSHRSALLPVKKKNNWLRKLFHLPERTTYKDFCGSRRVTIDQEAVAKGSGGGFYGNDAFRVAIHKRLLPHLTPNMEVFGEIVGWPYEGAAPLMGEVNTKCLNDKAFTKKYGEKMIFHYGCAEGTYDFYIYRICELDVDGDVRLEYSTDQIVAWCNQHGFKHMPILYRGFLTSKEDILPLAEKHADGESTLATHWREGCVIRRDNNAKKFDVYKNKNFAYKTMKGLYVENLQTDNLSEDIVEEM